MRLLVGDFGVGLGARVFRTFVKELQVLVGVGLQFPRTCRPLVDDHRITVPIYNNSSVLSNRTLTIDLHITDKKNFELLSPMNLQLP